MPHFAGSGMRDLSCDCHLLTTDYEVRPPIGLGGHGADGANP